MPMAAVPVKILRTFLDGESLFFIENFLNCGVFFYICNISNSKIRNYFLVKKKCPKRSHFEERVEFE